MLSKGPLHTEKLEWDIRLEQLCTEAGCRLEDLPEAKDDRDEWRERGLEKSALAAQHDHDDERS